MRAEVVTKHEKGTLLWIAAFNMEYAVIIHQAVTRPVRGMHSEADGNA